MSKSPDAKNPADVVLARSIFTCVFLSILFLSICKHLVEVANGYSVLDKSPVTVEFVMDCFLIKRSNLDVVVEKHVRPRRHLLLFF